MTWKIWASLLFQSLSGRTDFTRAADVLFGAVIRFIIVLSGVGHTAGSAFQIWCKLPEREALAMAQ